jgi:hypothetical protein
MDGAMERKSRMAQKVQVTLVDDIDGSAAAETVSFSLDGVAYEIDLNAKNAAKLRDAFATYVGSGRRVGGRSAAGGRRRTASARAGGNPETAKIREWARKNGHKVSERGRISAEVTEAYRKAGKK